MFSNTLALGQSLSVRAISLAGVFIFKTLPTFRVLTHLIMSENDEVRINTGTILNGIEVGRIIRIAVYRRICDAAAVCCNMRRHVIDVAIVAFAVLVHVVVSLTVVHLMVIGQMFAVADATEAIQFENTMGLSTHAIAVLAWRNVRIRSAICVSCRRR